MKPKIILRADGNNKIGLGHVYRLLALAGMLKDDFECVFAIANPDSFTLTQIKYICCDVIVLSTSKEYELPDKNKAHEEIPFDLATYLTGNEIVVTDGYLFGKEYQLSVKATGARLVCIDDLAEIDFYADIIINHAQGVDHSKYKKQSYTKLFTGLDYVILRQPFFKPLPVKRKVAENVFISLGGSDFFQYTKKLIELLLPYSQFNRFNILCSASFSKELLLYLEEKQQKDNRIKLHYNLNATELVNVLDACTYAFVSASTVLLESYVRGLKCFAGYYTNNQQFIYNGFVKEKFAIGLNSFTNIDDKTISQAISLERNLKVSELSMDSSKHLLNVFLSL